MHHQNFANTPFTLSKAHPNHLSNHPTPPSGRLNRGALPRHSLTVMINQSRASLPGMSSLAFSTPLSIHVHTPITTSTLKPCLTFEPPRLRRPTYLPLWRASGTPDPERNSSIPDDDDLNSELQAKVNELFGSRNNVTIDIERDSGVQFIVRRGPGSPDYEQTRAAWTVIISIGVLSVAAGVLFTALYYTGAVHGSNPSERRYDMPSYGSRSYINPYELLDEDRQFQESKAQ